MSRTAKATLAATVTFCSITIFTVHYMQRQEREVCVTFQARSSYSFLILTTQTMFQGVLCDDARRLEKHKQQEEALQESLQKRELYEKVQTVVVLRLFAKTRGIRDRPPRVRCVR